MPLPPDLVGRTFAPTAPYDVSAAKIGEFAAAVGQPPGPGGEAPPTFPMVVSSAALETFMRDPEVGISLQNVVHAEQRFTYTRQVRPGDVLVAALTVDGVRERGGADFVTTRSEITDAEGTHVCTALATLVHRAPQEVDLP